MASFNLGRIKGDKGDKGDPGIKGDKGERGDRGERGERGSDAPIPVFSVGTTNTLESSMEAYVEICTEDSENYVLNFSIPKGKDGNDALGDMKKSTYDPRGIGTDIFEYAKALYEECLKNSGGKLTGAVTACESPLESACVRNVYISTKFPENSANGDLCIIRKDENSKTLGECAEGSSVIISENGKDCEYLIIAKNYHSKNSVTLLRKNLLPTPMAFDVKTRLSYIMSDVDIFLETMYINQLPENISDSVIPVEVENNFLRRCFLLSYGELNSIDYFSQAGSKIAAIDNSSSKAGYITRSTPDSRSAYCVTENGIFGTVSQIAESHLRPVIVLTSDMAVSNTEYNSNPAVRAEDNPWGIYLFIDGQWKECR